MSPLVAEVADIATAHVEDVIRRELIPDADAVRYVYRLPSLFLPHFAGRAAEDRQSLALGIRLAQRRLLARLAVQGGTLIDDHDPAPPAGAG